MPLFLRRMTKPSSHPLHSPLVILSPLILKLPDHLLLANLSFWVSYLNICLLDISSWASHQQSKLNTSNPKHVSSKLLLSPTFLIQWWIPPITDRGAQDRNLGFLFSPPLPLPHPSIMEFCQCHLLNIFQTCPCFSIPTSNLYEGHHILPGVHPSPTWTSWSYFCPILHTTSKKLFWPAQLLKTRHGFYSLDEVSTL